MLCFFHMLLNFRFSFIGKKVITSKIIRYKNARILLLKQCFCRRMNILGE